MKRRTPTRAEVLKALADPALIDLRRALGQSTVNLPSPVNTLVGQMAENVVRSIDPDAGREFQTLYQEQVITPCRARVEGRYPFGSGGDIPLSDFALVFGPGGLYDKFFTERLENYKRQHLPTDDFAHVNFGYVANVARLNASASCLPPSA